MLEERARLLVSSAIVLAAGVVLALLGPFGTYPELSTGERWAYWLILTPLMALQIVAALSAMRRWATFARLPVWLQGVAGALLGAIPTTFEVAWVESLLRVGRPLSPLSMLGTYWGVALIALLLCVPLALLKRRWTAKAPGEAPAATSFHGRIPGRLRGRLLALRSEDHYLRIYTDRGNDLVLLPLTQAIAELSGQAGVRAHRSWWVARDAVEGCERDGDRTTLLLTGGLRVPVSRTYLLAVREAGLLRD